MIGLVRISPPGGRADGTVVMDSLPPGPPDHLSALVVQVEDEGAVARVLSWFQKVAVERPTFALGLVCPPESCAAALGTFVHPVRLVLSPDDLQGGSLPAAALATMRDASVEGLILDELHRKHGDAVDSDRTTVECLISHAVRGGTQLGRLRSRVFHDDGLEAPPRDRTQPPGDHGLDPAEGL